MRSRVFFYAVALVLVVAVGSAYGERVYDSLAELVSPPLPVLAAPISASDSASGASPVRPRKTYGNPKVLVKPTFSVPGATAVLEVWGFQRTGTTDAQGTLLLSQQVTASLTCTADGTRYIASDGYMVAPTLGHQTYDVRLRKIGSSDGNVNWSSWALGHDAIPAGTANE